MDGALLAVPSESALLTSPMLLFVARYVRLCGLHSKWCG